MCNIDVQDLARYIMSALWLWDKIGEDDAAHITSIIEDSIEEYIQLNKETE